MSDTAKIDPHTECVVCGAALKGATQIEHWDVAHPEEAAQLRRGIDDMRAGRVVSLSDLKREQAMSDTPGVVGQHIREYVGYEPDGSFGDPQLAAWVDAHDAEDVRRDADVQELWRVERQTAGQNERLRTALRLLDEAWTNSDTHPRHAPKTCGDCDRVYAATDALGVQG